MADLDEVPEIEVDFIGFKGLVEEITGKNFDEIVESYVAGNEE